MSESTPRPDRPEGAVEVRLRRAPKYGPFILTGVVVGVVLGVVVALVGGGSDGPDGLSTSSLVRYFAAVLGLLGAVAGAAAALLVERRRR